MGLKNIGTVVDAQIPSTIARDTEVTSAVSTHAGAADPHTGYLLESLLDAAGDMITASADNTPAKLAAGSDGQALRPITGAAPQWVTPASLQLAHATPTGTGSTTGVMAGLGDTFKLTPTKSGRVLVMIGCTAANDTVGDGVRILGKYGTGAAPANGDAITGTTFGLAREFKSVDAGAYGPPATFAVIAGLTVGTEYWFDVVQTALVGGTAQLSNVAITAIEL